MNTKEITKRKTYNGIDTIRFVMCILVVVSHTSAFSSMGSNVNFAISHVLAHLAIPIYFMASGFFLYKKVDGKEWSEINKILKKYALRIFQMYLIWSIIYFPLYISMQKSQGIIIKKIICKYLYNFIFSGTYIHLWYLLALIIAVILLRLGIKYNLTLKQILVISFILYLFGALGDSYYGLGTRIPVVNLLLKYILRVFGNTRNGIFVGLFFVTLGGHFAVINEKKENLLKWEIGSVFFILCLLLEGGILRKFNIPKGFNMFFFLIPSSYCLFQLVLHIKLPDAKAYKMLRELSTIIYFVHLWVAEIIRILQKIVGVRIQNSLLYFACVFLLSAFIAIIINKIETNKYFKWLVYFH